MADDSILRSYRSPDPGRRASAPAAPRDVGGSDPLAELARLIGQSDPYADLDRNSAPASEARQRTDQRTDSAPADWRKTAAALARESMRDPPAADPHFEQVDSAIAVAKSLRASPDDPFARPAPHSARTAFDHAAFDHAAFDEAAFDEAAFDQAPVHQAPVHQGGYADSPYDDEPQIADHIDDRLRSPRGAQQGGHESESYYFDGEAAPADERFYDDPPRGRATNGLVTAI